jgi:hypothetical protein
MPKKRQRKVKKETQHKEHRKGSHFQESWKRQSLKKIISLLLGPHIQQINHMKFFQDISQELYKLMHPKKKV